MKAMVLREVYFIEEKEAMFENPYKRAKVRGQHG